MFDNSEEEEKGLSLSKLTEREREILSLVAEGRSNKEVAGHLYVSKRTVDFHLANIYNKLEVCNRVQAFRKVMKDGLVPVAVQS